MADLSTILTDPNYVNANAETKAAIFDKFSATDQNYTSANAETQQAIRARFGVDSKPTVPPAPSFTPEQIAAHSKQSQRTIQGIEPSVMDVISAIPGVRMLTGAASIPLGAAEYLPGRAGKYVQEMNKDRAAMQKRGKTAIPEGINAMGSAAEFAGESAPYFAVPFASGASGLVPKAIQYGKNILTGSGVGALGAVTAPGGEGTGQQAFDRAGSGAAIGGAVTAGLPPLAWAGGKLWEVGRNVLAGSTGQAQNYLAEIFKTPEARREAIKRLESVRGYTPGERPTVGRAAVQGGEAIPAFKALEEGAKTRGEAQQGIVRQLQRGEDANANVFDRIAAVGRRPPAETDMPVRLSRAQAVRERMTQPLYKEADKDLITVSDDLSALLQGPEIQSAIGRGEKGLGQEITNALVGGKVSPSTGVPARSTPAYSMMEWGPSPVQAATKEPAKLSVAALQNIKKELDIEVNALRNDPLQQRRVETARNQLEALIRGGSPKYAAAQEEFRRLSAPQNQADVAEALLNAYRSPGGVSRPAALGQAWRNAPSTIKNKAGVPRFTEMGQVFSPTQYRQAQGVIQSANEVEAYKALSAPQGILPEIRGEVGKLEGDIPGFLSKSITAVRKIMAKAGGHIDEQSQKIIDNMITEPKALAEFMRKGTPEDRDFIMKYMVQAQRNGILPVVGASATEQQNQQGLLGTQ